MRFIYSVKQKLKRLKKLRPMPSPPAGLLNFYSANADKDLNFTPKIVHIETRSMCNGSCSFCAAAIQFNTRPDVLMKDELIDKIFAELAELNFADRLSLYCNNEPFADKRIFDIVDKARKMLPRAYIELKSNGKLLTADKIFRIFNAGLDMLYVNDYQKLDDNGELKLSPKIKKIKAEVESSRRLMGHYDGSKFQPRVEFTPRFEDEVLLTRAGSSPNAKALSQPIKQPCFRPFEMISISPNGDVALCSEDIKFDAVMGNLNEQGLMEVWNSSEYKKVREELVNGNRAVKSTCAQCDNVGFKQEPTSIPGFSAAEFSRQKRKYFQ